MRKLIPAVIAAIVLASGPAVIAQTSAPTEAPATERPQVPTVPPVQQTDAPNQAPTTRDTTTDDDGGLSSTAILLIVLGAVVLLLLIFAIAFSQRRRPGDPLPPD